MVMRQVKYSIHVPEIIPTFNMNRSSLSSSLRDSNEYSTANRMDGRDSIGSTSDDEDVVSKLTVKFVSDDSAVCTTQSHGDTTSIEEVKIHLAEVFQVPYAGLSLFHEKEELHDSVILRDLAPEAFGVLELVLKSQFEITLNTEDYTVPDVITVRIQTSREGIKEVVVEVEDRTIRKPFVGGFFDKYSGIEYHHGFTQTGPRKSKISPWMRNHRETQTYCYRNRKIEMSYSRATQMSNQETFIPAVTDRILSSKPYETAEEREVRLDIEGKVKIIQRYFRAWKMKKALKELSLEYHKRLRLQMDREAAEEREDVKRKKRDLISKVFPRTAADFSMLYAMTERWKRGEIKRILSMHCGPAKIAEFYLLLEKEIEVLRSIEALRQKMRNDRRLQKELEFFKIIGDPVKWISTYKNLPIEMDTLETQKGRKYQELYRKICERNIERAERLEVLQDLKVLLFPHNCQLSTELIGLIDRACEMLARGFSNKDLEVLNRRIEALLLQHFKLPECNEGVTDMHMMNTEKKLRNNLHYCQSCHKLKPMEDFSIELRSENVTVCSTCKFIDKAREPWIDISPYRFILRQVRRYERLHHAVSSMAFILRDKDIYFLVTHIWHGHSALSECADIYELRLCRWYRDMDWSPWNCILLTKDEAKSHLKVDDLESVYDQNFLSKVFSKHALAKSHFGKALDIEKCVNQAKRPVAKKESSEHCLKDEDMANSVINSTTDVTTEDSGEDVYSDEEYQ